MVAQGCTVASEVESLASVLAATKSGAQEGDNTVQRAYLCVALVEHVPPPVSLAAARRLHVASRSTDSVVCSAFKAHMQTVDLA